MALYLLSAILLAGTGHILADAGRHFRAAYVLKPLTMGLIIALAALEGSSGGAYRPLVLCGLAASLAGDIALMLRRRRRLSRHCAESISAVR